MKELTSNVKGVRCFAAAAETIRATRPFPDQTGSRSEIASIELRYVPVYMTTDNRNSGCHFVQQDLGTYYGPI